VRRHPGVVCAGELKRDWQYGLYYYAGAVLPSCEDNPKQLQVLQTPGRPPSLVRAGSGTGTATPPGSVDPR